ncbi:MAG TPA: bifunctional diguanylate cyclase/phosphodiesterase [Acidimicrobiales bacterium]|nr:bifunctional diguanylate cyclase/phosphodiesterase [Acidimicrobiales bacterium]
METTRRPQMLALVAGGLTLLAPFAGRLHAAALVAAGLVVALLLWLAPHAGPRRRAGWQLIVGSALLVSLTDVWFRLAFSGRDPAVPSPADALFVAGYACLLGGVVLLFHQPQPDEPRSAVLDGVLLGLAAAALAEGTFLGRLVGDPGGGLAVAAVSRSYLVLDLCLAGTVVALARTDLWHERRWRLLALATTVLIAADLGYLRRVGSGDLVGEAWYHPLYVVVGLALAAAVWTPPPAPRHRPVETARMVFLPGGVAAVAAVVLVFDHVDARTDLAVALATIALLVVGVRAGLTVHYLHQLADARRLALTDDLTGLPNRRWFLDQLDQAVKASPPAPFALLLVGLDRFKDLNDTLGHRVGDQVLQDAAARITGVLHGADRLARLGGDEFAAIVAGDERAADSAAAAVTAAFAEPLAAGDLALPVDVSVGGTHCSDGSAGVETLLRRADVALHEAKRADDHRAMYRREQDRFSVERLSLGAELRAAIRDGGLTVVYQPIVDLRTGRPRRAEALVRWEHPRHGLLLPGAFLDVAQQTGSMRALTAVVLDAALEQAGQWRGGGLDLAVCVNLPPSALLDAGLPAAVGAALERSGLPAAALGLELTENGLLEDPDTALGILRSLRDLGVRLAVDDYGTGYASLSYLRDLPVHSLKIDRSFLAGIADEGTAATARNGALVRSTIGLAHELGFDVVAEGVEDARTLERLRQFGVDSVQGYLVGRPASGAAVAEVWGGRGGRDRVSRRGRASR